LEYLNTFFICGILEAAQPDTDSSSSGPQLSWVWEKKYTKYTKKYKTIFS